MPISSTSITIPRSAYVGSCTPGVAGSLTTAKERSTAGKQQWSFPARSDDQLNITRKPPSRPKRKESLPVCEGQFQRHGWMDGTKGLDDLRPAAPTLGTVTPSIISMRLTLPKTSALSTAMSMVCGSGHGWTDSWCNDKRAGSIYLAYEPGGNTLIMYDDTGTAYADSCTPGVAGQRDQQSGNAELRGQRPVIGSGNNLTLTEHHADSRLRVAIREESLLVCADNLDTTVGWTDKETGRS